MDSNQVRACYKAHSYSGPKNKTAVRAQLKRYHGEDVSRENVWRKKPKLDTDSNNKKAESSKPEHSSHNLKTYSRVPKYHVEANIAPKDPDPTNIEAQSTPLILKPQASKAKALEINWPVDPTVQSHQLTIEKDQTDPLDGMSGYRIVNLHHVLRWAFDLEKHRASCAGSLIQFLNESRNGFNSTFTFQCTMCKMEFRKCNEQEEKLNKSFVWGTVTAGSYYTQIAHVTNLMDIPTMSAQNFRQTEKLLGQVWQDHLTEQIKEVGEQEKAIALKKGHVNSDGVPYITVYVDGGWAKRSYGHDYNSPSGMACIIGKETKKCLFVGVKNKYCFHCHVYEKEKKTPPTHTCFKNFEGPSSSMEATILVEGFKNSEQMHGVQYLFFIGDGDSSVYAQLRDKVSYGQNIRKIECKNHVMKNYTGALYKILADTKLPLFGRKILKPRVTKLTAVSRKIIIKNCDDRQHMRDDLKNGPLHVFGRHANCQEYYCKFKATGEQDKDHVEEMKSKATAVWGLICAANENVMTKTNRMSNETTNIAENFMSIVSKFNCGKRLNLHKGGSYQRRVHVAGLSQIHGQKWHESAWRKHTKTTPGKTFKTYIRQQQKSKERKKKCTRRRLFVTKQKQVQPDKHYGPCAQDIVDSLDEANLKNICEEKLTDFQKTAQEIEDIEMMTVGQHENDMYNTHRCDRLTASNFGVICKRRDKTPCHNHVKTILYKNNILTSDMLYGQNNEAVARTLFVEKYKKSVRLSGLFIDEEYGFLGASPDGVVQNEKAILEIKCFPSLARNNQDIVTAAKERKDFALMVNEEGSLEMNKKHNYYYQVQGQLRITKSDYCYFVCYISPTKPITVLKIDRDEEFIKQMIPKLVTFYKNSVLPEVILRKVNKNQKCIDLHLF